MRHGRLSAIAFVAGALLASCQLDRGIQPSAVSFGPQCTSGCTVDSEFVIKVQLKNGTWYVLKHPGDFLAVNSINGASSTFKIRSAGVDHSVVDSAITVDAGGFNGKDQFLFQTNPSVFFFSTGINPYGAVQIAYQYDTIKLASVDANFNAYYHVNYGYPSNNHFDAYAPANNSDHSGGFTGDNTGSIRMASCTSTPICFSTPTSVTLAAVGPYPKITWNNNGGADDSTEVWFGILFQETKRAVVAPGITSYFASWGPSGIYRAFVFHRWGNGKGANAYSNTLTH